VGLECLPDSFCDVLKPARKLVANRAQDLLAGESLSH
jgi:hypothetical protein